MRLVGYTNHLIIHLQTTRSMISNVYNMDCMEGMKQFPDKFFELAIVDPPYGIGDFNQSRRRKIHKAIEWNDDIPTQEYFIELEMVSKHRIIWGSEYYARFINDRGRIVHDKTGGGKRMQLPELSDVDIASHSFGVNQKIFHFTWQGNVQGNSVNWNNSGSNGRVHPCQKPIELYKWCLDSYAKSGDKILDTHMGSQSSRIAAYQMGFDYWGYEIDKDYFEAGCKRFDLVTSQLRMML